MFFVETAKHACTLRMVVTSKQLNTHAQCHFVRNHHYEQSVTVNWCVVVWCMRSCSCMVYTELAPRRQQFHVAPAMQQLNGAVTTLLESSKRSVQIYSHSFTVANY